MARAKINLPYSKYATMTVILYNTLLPAEKSSNFNGTLIRLGIRTLKNLFSFGLKLQSKPRHEYTRPIENKLKQRDPHGCDTKRNNNPGL